MKSKRAAEGYLMIDHSASPGLPAGFMRSLGLEGLEAPCGLKVESPTVTCAHCGTIVMLNPQRTRARGYCPKCDSYVCDNPACNAECAPLSKTLDLAESAAYRQQQNTLILNPIALRSSSNG